MKEKFFEFVRQSVFWCLDLENMKKILRFEAILLAIQLYIVGFLGLVAIIVMLAGCKKEEDPVICADGWSGVNCETALEPTGVMVTNVQFINVQFPGADIYIKVYKNDVQQYSSYVLDNIGSGGSYSFALSQISFIPAQGNLKVQLWDDNGQSGDALLASWDADLIWQQNGVSFPSWYTSTFDNGMQIKVSLEWIH